MSEKKMLLTYSGLKEREDELRHLKTVKRKEIAEKIKEARNKGDLSENAEYDAAKEEQAKYEARIAELEKMLRAAVVIDEEDLDKDVVGIGSKVTLFSEEFGEDEEYVIVGSAEANPAGGKISNESPLGSVILGRRVGDEVFVDAPAGIIKYVVKSIA
ncbi:MAG: transcription elongation factor GreA [Defluviitaleaceae bacterium]|nr:transcription elongation factor GreA [Defluviitaleaceae bacterium]MCL2836900.1 transcription elongation factor GreA [Defluviitaleaceae bacterium]